METVPQTTVEHLQILSNYNLAFMAVRAGQGHLTQAEELRSGLLPGSPHCTTDLTAVMQEYSCTGAETHAASMLNYFNDEFLTRDLLSRLPSAGMHIFNKAVDPGFALIGFLHKVMGIAHETPFIYQYEEQLPGTMAHFIKDMRIDAFICTLTSPGRIVNLAKALKMLPENLPVFNLVFDPMGPHLTHSIYDPATQFGIDPHTYNLVADERTRKIFLSRGYPEDKVVIMDGEYVPSPAEVQVIDSKLADLEMFRFTGPLPERPLIVSIVHDNFETPFEQGVSERLPADYATEEEDGRIIFCLTMNAQKLRSLGLAGTMYICETAEQLEQFLCLPELRSQYRGAVVVKPGITNSIAARRNYTAQQRLLALHSHINVSRPSEQPRAAARFSTPSFLTMPFASQEAYMANIYQNAGFAANWIRLGRSSLSGYRRKVAGLAKLDLNDPFSYNEIQAMAQSAQITAFKSGTAGVLAQIASKLRNYPISTF